MFLASLSKSINSGSSYLVNSWVLLICVAVRSVSLILSVGCNIPLMNSSYVGRCGSFLVFGSSMKNYS